MALNTSHFPATFHPVGGRCPVLPDPWLLRARAGSISATPMNSPTASALSSPSWPPWCWHVMGAGMLLLKAIPRAPSEKLLGMLLAAAVLLWLQGNILVWNYGLLDGHDIQWSQKIYLGLIDTPLWILLLLLAFVYSPVIKKFARPLSSDPDRSPNPGYFDRRGSECPKARHETLQHRRKP